VPAVVVDPQPIEAPWIHGHRRGEPDGDPDVQVRALDETTFVLRQSMSRTFEAPFLYLLLGGDRALLLDTGAVADPRRCDVRRVVGDGLGTHPPGAPLVDVEVARHREQPGLERPALVVAVDPRDHLEPGLLEQVLGRRGIGGEPEQVAVQAVLVPREERIERIGVTPPESRGLALDAHPVLPFEDCCREHARYTGTPGKKTQARERCKVGLTARGR
jgi:hypothetical protein